MEKKKFVKKQGRVVLFLMLLLLFPLGALAQQKMIKGQVVDDSGEAIIGATVMVKGNTGGTITDIDGNFSIQGKVGSILSITYVGYAPMQVKVTKLEGNKYVMKEDAKVLDEVVVVGMDTQKRNTITAAVATLKDDAIVNRPVTDVTSALQGNIAGLNFATDAVGGGVGGETGADIKFSIRGIGSINGGEPYVLVDGVEQSMQNVNPADIASISVLKDASASAVYGARAAYGVVLVTTKSGKKERASVTYRGTVGFSSPINMPKMMNSLEYAMYNNQQYDNGGASSGLQRIPDKTIEKIKGFMQNPYSAEFPGIEANTSGDDWAGAYYNQYGNTDWFDYYFKDKSIRHSHNLSVQGGSDKVNYYIGMGYTYQEGLLDQVQDDLSKYNLNTKLQMKTNNWLRFNLNNNITLQMIKRPMANQMILYNKIGSHRPTQVTQLPVDSEYNLPSWNEMLYLKNSHYQRNRISDALSLSATVTPLEGWDITGEMKIRFDIENNDLIMENNQKYETPVGTFKPGDATNQRQGFTYPGISWKNMYFGSYTRGSMFNYYLSPNVSSSYTHQWGDHFFKAMAGYQMELKEDSQEYMYKDGMLSNDIYSFDNASGNVIAGEARSHWSTMGFYARLNWNYNNIYFLEFSGRYDGSSKFPTDQQWAFFPSVSGGWRVSEEAFWKVNPDLFSNLKIRASYGSLGNGNVSPYSFLELLSISTSGRVLNGLKNKYTSAPAVMPDGLTWETATTTDVGLDFGMLNNRLQFNGDYYIRKTTDMYTVGETLPDVFGASSPKGNYADMTTKGWEITLTWRDQFTLAEKPFNYEIRGTLSDYISTIDRYNNQTGNLDDYYAGKRVGEIWGYVTEGLFKDQADIDSHADQTLIQSSSKRFTYAGDVKIKDLNGDHVIDYGNNTVDDHGDKTVIGNALPRYAYSINLSGDWNNFFLSAFFQGVGKQDWYPSSECIFWGQYNRPYNNMPTWHQGNYWTEDNTDAYLPRYAGYNASLKSTPQTRYLQNVAYIRLKNLQFGYTLPQPIVSKAKLQNVRVYISAENLWCWSPLYKHTRDLDVTNIYGSDPDLTDADMSSGLNGNRGSGDGNSYPQMKSVSLGLSVTF